MKKSLVIAFVLVSMILVACDSAKLIVSPNQGSANGISQSSRPRPTATQASSFYGDMVRTDNQGAVAFMVEPNSLDPSSDTLSFDISMNTHSVDLNMDLASLATLATDNGNSVQGLSWDGQKGGHHVSGTLVFPADKDGKSLLAGAKELKLTIINVDAPERVFTWEINQ